MWKVPSSLCAQTASTRQAAEATAEAEEAALRTAEEPDPYQGDADIAPGWVEKPSDRSLRMDHEDAALSSSVKPDGQKTRQESFFFDRGDVDYERRSERATNRLGAQWTLGLGSASAKLAEAEASGSLSRQWARHRVFLRLGLSGKALEDAHNFQTLDEQYADAYRSGIDVEDVTRLKSHRFGQSLQLADSWQSRPDLRLGVDYNLSRERFRVDAAVDDTSSYQQVLLSADKGLGRATWENRLSRADLFYESTVNDFSQSQVLYDASSGVLMPLPNGLRWGLGYAWIRLEDERGLSGPTATLLRLPSERLSWRLTAKALRGEDREQLFGSAELQYQLTRTQQIRLNGERNIDLFSSYSFLTVERLPLTQQQRSNLRTTLTWERNEGRSRWSLLAHHDRQDFSEARIKETGWDARLEQHWNQRNLSTLNLGFRRNEELGSILREADRRYLTAALSWKHFWGGSTPWLGPRPYLHLQVTWERLFDEPQDYALERASALLGIGQAWL